MSSGVDIVRSTDDEAAMWSRPGTGPRDERLSSAGPVVRPSSCDVMRSSGRADVGLSSGPDSVSTVSSNQ